MASHNESLVGCVAPTGLEPAGAHGDSSARRRQHSGNAIDTSADARASGRGVAIDLGCTEEGVCYGPGNHHELESRKIRNIRHQADQAGLPPVLDVDGDKSIHDKPIILEQLAHSLVRKPPKVCAIKYPVGLVSPVGIEEQPS